MRNLEFKEKPVKYVKRAKSRQIPYQIWPPFPRTHCITLWHWNTNIPYLKAVVMLCYDMAAFEETSINAELDSTAPNLNLIKTLSEIWKKWLPDFHIFEIFEFKQIDDIVICTIMFTKLKNKWVKVKSLAINNLQCTIKVPKRGSLWKGIILEG